ncbi:MAG: 2'-5' RNA ligase family protein [Chloroflexota bacterium]
MSVLFTLGYPEISANDKEFIEGIRQKHDPQFDLVQAHFTLVFGIHALEPKKYIDHVAAVAEKTNEIEFICRYAMLGADSFSDHAHVFLVPDEGYSAISLLHDQLYTGIFEPFHRLDIPFIPHITIATMTDRREAKSLCDTLNQEGIEIAGAIKSLVVGTSEGNRFTKLAGIQLGES